MILGDFNVEPIPCLAKGISAGLWVDFEKAWALTFGLQPAPSCKRDWSAAGGHRRDFILGCPLAGAALSLVKFSLIGGLLLILLLGLSLIAVGGLVGLLSRIRVLPFGLPHGCLLLFKSRGSKSVEVRNVWEVYDDRLQFISWRDTQRLSESHDADDVSSAWLAAEAALADASRFSGGPVPSRGLILGRGSAFFGIVQLGGPWVKSVRGNVANAVDAADIFLYRDSSIAPLLVMRRRFKAVMDVLGAMIRYGVSLPRSVELTIQWERILAARPLYLSP